jgi:hypothetical protein
MRRRIVLLLFLLAVLAACDVKPVIKRRVTLNFADDRQYVRVTATTEIGASGRGAIQQRLAAEREALRNETDEWSKRIASVAPVSEEIVTQRQNGAIQRVEHSAVIQRDDLQRFFSDLPLTITLMRGDGFSELSLYPGTSTRATRTQREEVKAILEASSADAARYINATSVLYQYLDAHPERATAVFTILYDEKQTSTIEEEQGLIETVRTTADTLLQRLETSERNAFTIDEEFDLVYNPFSAEIAIRTPREIVAAEGFEKTAADGAFIRRAGLLDALGALETHWISPNLLRAALVDEQPLPAEELARMPRKGVAMVTASEIEQAIAERLRPASVYRVRWAD